LPQAFENVYVIPVQAQAHLTEDVLRDSVIAHPIARWHTQRTRTSNRSLVRLRDGLTVALAAATTGDSVKRTASIRPTLTTLLAALDQQKRRNASPHRVSDCIVTLANASCMHRTLQ
jgi:hypothetical protein